MSLCEAYFVVERCCNPDAVLFSFSFALLRFDKVQSF